MNDLTETTTTDSALAEYAETMRREDRDVEAAEIFGSARSKMIIQPKYSQDGNAIFFINAALKLEPVADWTINRCAVDGKQLRYNPDWLCSLGNDDMAISVIVESVLHCVLHHISRRGNRDNKTWQEAADCATHSIMHEANFVLPPVGVAPGTGKYKDFAALQSVEEYFGLLRDDKEQEQQQGDDPDGDGDGDPGDGACEAQQAGSDAAENAANEQEWNVITAQAQQIAQQRQPGTMSAGLLMHIEKELSPKVDWRAVLREFVQQRAREDYRWSAPNKRWASQGFTLPGMQSESLGDIAVIVDTSGSCVHALPQFASEIVDILSGMPNHAKIIYHDFDVQKVQDFDGSDCQIDISDLDFQGGGGTSHVPAFNYLNEQEPPCCAVLLTDCWTNYPTTAPDYPCLWIVVENKDPHVPFGDVIFMELDRE